MIEQIKVKLMKFVVSKYLMGYLVKAWNFLRGYKTQIGIAAAIVVFSLKVAGVIDESVYKNAIEAISVWTGIAFIDKVARYKDSIEGVIEEVRKNSN